MVLEVTPRPLFGKHSYMREQQLMGHFGKQVDYAVLFVVPAAAGVPLPFNRLPVDYRRRKVREHLAAAREALKELGV